MNSDWLAGIRLAGSNQTKSQQGKVSEHTVVIPPPPNKKLLVVDNCLERKIDFLQWSISHILGQVLCLGVVGQHKTHSLFFNVPFEFCITNFLFLVFFFWEIEWVGRWGGLWRSWEDKEYDQNIMGKIFLRKICWKGKKKRLWWNENKEF